MDSRASQDSCSEVAALVDARFLRPELFRYYYGGKRLLGVLHSGGARAAWNRPWQQERHEKDCE